MNSTNFSEEFIPKINGVLKFVLESPYSDFYRKKYGNQISPQIASYKDFQKIPILHKKEFLSVDLSDRLFVPEEEITYYSFSSGTTDKNKPTVMAHNSLYPDCALRRSANKERVEKLGVKDVLMLMPPLSPAVTRLPKISQEYYRLTIGDIQNLKLMATIAKEIKIQGIMTTATILEFFINELEEINFDLGAIKWISIGGEACSSLKFDYLKSKLPNAFFNVRYATSEIGGNRYYQCDHIRKKNATNVFHIIPGVQIIEILDSENKSVLPGETGEITHTDLNRKAFPLIRYKTADVGKLEKIDCPCQNPDTLTLSGRAQFDVLKFYGTTINVEAAAGALKQLSEFIEPSFQVHVFEEKTGEKIKPRLELHLKLKKDFRHNEQDEFFKEMIKEKFSSQFYLSAKSTLKQLVDQNIFLPLKIVFVGEWPGQQGKFKNIISHLS